MLLSPALIFDAAATEPRLRFAVQIQGSNRDQTRSITIAIPCPTPMMKYSERH